MDNNCISESDNQYESEFSPPTKNPIFPEPTLPIDNDAKQCTVGISVPESQLQHNQSRSNQANSEEEKAQSAEPSGPPVNNAGGGRPKPKPRQKKETPLSFPPNISPLPTNPFSIGDKYETLKEKRIKSIAKIAHKNDNLRDILESTSYDNGILDLLLHPKYDEPLKKYGTNKQLKHLSQLVEQIAHFSPEAIHFLNKNAICSSNPNTLYKSLKLLPSNSTWKKERPVKPKVQRKKKKLKIVE